MPIYVRVEFEIRVDLPEGNHSEDWPDGEDHSCPEELKERIFDAAQAAVKDCVDVYIDGKDEPPARVWTEFNDGDVIEYRAEGD